MPNATGDSRAWKLFYPGQTYTVYQGTDTENRPVTLRYPSSQAVVYDRDGDGRITRIRLKTGTNTYITIVDLVSYKSNGPVASLKYGDGYTETLSYDASYRLTGMLDANATVTLRNLTLGYDAKDNLTGVTDNLAAPQSEALTYSPRDMLASATGAYGTLGWTYDGVGNRVSEVRNPGTGSVTDTYTYPTTSNRLSSVATSGGGNRALGYDAAGPRIARRCAPRPGSPRATASADLSKVPAFMPPQLAGINCPNAPVAMKLRPPKICDAQLGQQFHG